MEPPKDNTLKTILIGIGLVIVVMSPFIFYLVLLLANGGRPIPLW